MAGLTVSVVSADQEVWTGDATMVVARTTEGQIGVLAGHEPMLAILAQGQVRISRADGSTVHADAEDGFLSVEHDTVTIVARQAALASTGGRA
ncbi:MULTISPECIES: F0F1 ATP synthase subunit epsilon [unclassified Curtobacterium]|uniref:F0F1 ATP synthase subunit epsilon n=1 Tax=unclassified Curtobacterium TaxID=257496 RepID=UPI000DAA4EFA|nr:MULTISPECIES: F0F1 ATP synthase subunit epsilon [unclassified Curtobacterium]PZE28858.1 F0F1 ATP synthase subunit epsilon [Curtobacterium sp. MCBD17_028]PZE77210.1 F0F1 ATP synthase subunit epsilon [Curtobacterium sp. MCBD17_019]PZF59108.1 F0F1 ATP synthase subunit epsilon [Curtobacterium sp. MCBD17_034]PZF65240.1 F0F1 ATP synthase subunit epsilon [Curtobacterium sp. MCBD17_013]PZM34349.1 F0F1 ATP synthase subunit epsilon [Curtobacterium sp. MCBD17_031]